VLLGHAVVEREPEALVLVLARAGTDVVLGEGIGADAAGADEEPERERSTPSARAPAREGWRVPLVEAWFKEELMRRRSARTGAMARSEILAR